MYFVRLRLGLPVPTPPQKIRIVKPKRPVLWDVFPERAVEGGKWSDMHVSLAVPDLLCPSHLRRVRLCEQPLSGWFLRQADSLTTMTNHDSSPEYPASLGPDFIPRTRGPGVMRITAVPAPLPPRPRGFLFNRPHPAQSFREYWRETFHPTIHPNPSEKTEIESLRVAVLVAMPSQEHHWRGKAMGDRRSEVSSSSDGGSVGEVALGIADVSWRWNEAALEDSSSKAS